MSGDGSVGVERQFNYVEVYGRSVCYNFQATGGGVCSYRAKGEEGSPLNGCEVLYLGLLLCTVCPEVAAICDSGPDYSSVGPFH